MRQDALRGCEGQEIVIDNGSTTVHNATTMSFTFQTLCKENYHEFCLNGGECYVVSMKDEEEAVACMCTYFYGGGRCENYMWWT